ncbi:hypothetical protein [Pendulispora albinea]|uniref:Uncharacterized protein n=1 Tax=Pendulispora albinea TaxID=2741071 RepID=A0ABZ2MAA7_9BACT
MNDARVDEAIARAQEEPLAWDATRAARVLSSITCRNQKRLRRRRWTQRAFVLTGACTWLVVASLRAASAPPSASKGEPTGAPHAMANRAAPLDDGGAAARDGS